MLKRILAFVLSGVMILSTGCGLTSETKNRLFGDKWVTRHVTWVINNGNREYLSQLIQENKDKKDLLDDALGMAVASTRITKNKAFIVEQLLEAGADPNIRGTSGDKLLIENLYNYKGCFDVTAALLSSDKTDLSAKGDTGKDVLFYAMSTGNKCEYWSYYQVKMLVKAGAKPTKELFQKNTDYKGTYDHLQNSPYSTKYLLNILLKNGEESGLPLSLEYALLGESDKAISEIEKSDKDLDEEQKKLFVRYIMLWGTPKQFEEVLARWNMNFSDYKSCKATAQTNNVNMLKYIIEKSDIDITSTEDDISLDALEYAATMGSLDACKYLCENGCITKAFIDRRYWLLACAIESQNFDVFKTIYSYLNSKEKLSEDDVDEALNEAFKIRLYTESFSEFNRKVVDFLFEKGYNLENISISSLDYEGYKYITEKGRPVCDMDLFDAMDSTDINMFKFAVENGADINCINPRAKVNGLEVPVINDAVMTGTDFVRILVDKKVKFPDDIMESTPNASTETVKLLIDSGVNTDIKFAQIPASATQGDMKNGDFDLKDYWKAYDREDLIELLD